MGASCGNGGSTDGYRDMDKASMSGGSSHRRVHHKHDSIEDSVDDSGGGGVRRMSENAGLASPTLSSVPSDEGAPAMIDRIGALTSTVNTLQKQVNSLEKENEGLKQQLLQSKKNQRRKKHDDKKSKHKKKSRKKRKKHGKGAVVSTYQDSSSDIDDTDLGRTIGSPEREVRDPSQSVAAVSKRASLVYRTDTMRELDLNPESNKNETNEHDNGDDEHVDDHHTEPADDRDESYNSSADGHSDESESEAGSSSSSSSLVSDSSEDDEEESDMVGDLNTVSIGIKGRSLTIQKENRELKQENERLKQDIADFESDMEILMLALCDQEDFIEELQLSLEKQPEMKQIEEEKVEDPTILTATLSAGAADSERRPSRHIRFSPDQSAVESVSSDPTATIPKTRITSRSSAASVRLSHLSSKSLSRFNRIASAAVRGTVDPSDMQPTMAPLPDSDTEIG